MKLRILQQVFLALFLPVTLMAQSASVVTDVTTFSFTQDNQTFREDFNSYRGSLETLPEHFFVTWDEDRTENPFTGTGKFNTADPDESYGGFVAYTADDENFSFGIREREPVDLRDSRLFFAFTNNTGAPIHTFKVSYEVEAWFIGDRRNRIRLKYDRALEYDDEDRDTFEEDIFSTDNPSDVTTVGAKVNGSLENNRVVVTDIVDIREVDMGTGNNFTALADGRTAYFRWQFSNADGDGGSLRSGLAINNIMVSLDLDAPTSADDQLEMADRFELRQNYPNPFNPVTVIGFQLPVNSQVRLAIYDLLGREVAVPVDGHLSAGSHEITFDASSLNSGIYLYRLETPAGVLNRKMTLVK